jgi:hypothetical protein
VIDHDLSRDAILVGAGAFHAIDEVWDRCRPRSGAEQKQASLYAKAVPLLPGRDTVFSRHVEVSRCRGADVEMSRPARV